MKILTVFFLVLFTYNSSATAKSLAYIPEPEDRTVFWPLGITAGVNVIAVVVTADHINKCNKLLRNPFAGLTESNIRGLKSRRIFMPILGAIQLTYGIYATKWAKDEWTKSSERPWIYFISATFLVGGGLSIFDAIKSHQVLSKYRFQK